LHGYGGAPWKWPVFPLGREQNGPQPGFDLLARERQSVLGCLGMQFSNKGKQMVNQDFAIISAN